MEWGMAVQLDEWDIVQVMDVGRGCKVLAAEYPRGLDYWRDWEVLPPLGFEFDREVFYRLAGEGLQLVGLKHLGAEGPCRVEVPGLRGLLGTGI